LRALQGSDPLVPGRRLLQMADRLKQGRFFIT
jgi:hypothetical protein